jgi:hypothetical protein
MIRRGFWLAAGAVTGIYGYRRVSAIGRRLSASLNPSGLNPSGLNPSGLNPSGLNPSGRDPSGLNPSGLTQGAALARRGRRGAIGLARETFRFTHDVREGMQLYTARHSAPAGSTLSTDHSTNHEPKDGH